MSHDHYGGLLAGLAGLLVVVGSIAGGIAAEDEQARRRAHPGLGLWERLLSRRRAHPRAVGVQIACVATACALLVAAAVALL